jgi:hypothetical protein
MLKTVSSITNAIGALNYKGTWNASTNTLDGISNWGVGDVVAFNGTTWQRIEGGADLNGVNLSYTGTMTGSTDVINIGSGQIYKDSAGNIQIGTIGLPSGYGNRLFVEGAGSQYPVATKINTTEGAQIQFLDGANESCGTIYSFAGSNTTAYFTTSDYRLKENVKPMSGALNKVALLNPVTYTWKKSGIQGQGFIAHELQAVVPDCVGGLKDAVDDEGNPIYQEIDTSFLVATLTAAIKELKSEIDSVKAELQTLKGV